MKPETDAPAQPLVAWGPPSKELLAILADALPTRCRPQGSLDGDRHWAEFADELARFVPSAQGFGWEDRSIKHYPMTTKSALEWLCEHVKEGQPAAISLEGGREWVQNIRACFYYCYFPGVCVARLRPFLQWLLTKIGPSQCVELFLGIFDWEDIHDCAVSQGSDLNMALRCALVKAPESYYNAALALLRRYCTEQPSADLKRRARLAFILSDDRPGLHELQSAAVLREVAATGDRKMIRPQFLRLILDAPASGLAW